LRLVALAVLGMAMVSCSFDAAPAPTPSASPPPQSQAADLRVHLDLLLSEQVMIIAKESAAAVNHSDEYVPYTSLLATNSGDLSNLISRAFGNTSATQFAQLWNAQDAYLVDYAIGVVTHNDDKAKAAIASLTGDFSPQFARLVSSLSDLPLDPVAQLISQQVLEDKAFIDDVFAGGFTAYYADLHRAYGQTLRLGDALASQIAAKFPDRYPGDVSTSAVDARTTLNQLLQEHSYVATMMTDAIAAGRTAEKAQAQAALSANTTALGSAVADPRFMLLWSQESSTLAAYASAGDAASRSSLTDGFVAQLASVAKATPASISDHVRATIKVVDDQRSKSSKNVADDDRAAATSVQAIADAAL
jgi:hypothetical protein